MFISLYDCEREYEENNERLQELDHYMLGELWIENNNDEDQEDDNEERK